MFDDIYTEEYLNEIIAHTIEVAAMVYKTRARNIHHLETIDDFIQEALLHITKLFNERYIPPKDENKGKIRNLINTLLSGTFILNRYTILTRDKNNYNLSLDMLQENTQDEETYSGFGDVGEDIIATQYMTPDAEYMLELGETIFKQIVEHNLKTVSPTLEEGYYEPYGFFSASEYDVFNLGLLNLSGSKISELLNHGVTRQSINRINTRATKKVMDAVNELHPDDLEAVLFYLENN